MELSQRVTLTCLDLKAKKRGERPRRPSEMELSLDAELRRTADRWLNRTGYN